MRRFTIRPLRHPPIGRLFAASPPGIKISGLSLASGLRISMEPGAHTAADVAAAIAANNPADAGMVDVTQHGLVFGPRAVHVVIGAAT